MESEKTCQWSLTKMGSKGCTAQLLLMCRSAAPSKASINKQALSCSVPLCMVSNYTQLLEKTDTRSHWELFRVRAHVKSCHCHFTFSESADGVLKSRPSHTTNYTIKLLSALRPVHFCMLFESRCQRLEVVGWCRGCILCTILWGKDWFSLFSIQAEFAHYTFVLHTFPSIVQVKNLPIT